MTVFESTSARMSPHRLPVKSAASAGLRTFQLVRLPQQKFAPHLAGQKADFDESELLCDERLDAKSPELWPEQVRGVSRFLSSLVPLGTSPGIDCSQNEWTSEFSSEEISLLYKFGNLSENAVQDQIRAYHNLSFQLGLEEAHEMTRGNLLQIFGQQQ